MTAPTRPPGDVVAPLPEGWFVCDGGDSVVDREIRCIQDDGTEDMVNVYDERSIYIEESGGGGCASTRTGAAIRALHDAGHLDDYRDRCEAAAWVTFSSIDSTTNPPDGVDLLVLGHGGPVVWPCVYVDGWPSRIVDRYRVETMSHGTQWRPMVALPEGA
jgi:hypothetical protein